ncbi:MAG: protein translocase subunit SecD [Candidatus Peribacteraceae bacterium]|nr:protein translocase subunit SecD [Candidatus Peribacteraceae bacterium]
MPEKRIYFWPSTIAGIAALLVIVALPTGAKPWAPGFLRSPSFHFGLDLVGGTQLDFRISERELNEQAARIEAEIESLKGSENAESLAMLNLQLQTIEEQKTNVVEAIRTVLERRINSLGVSEAVITPSYVGDEKHLLVECPGIVDVQKCIEIVGKTIKLEFKEEFLTPTEEFEGEVRARASAALARITQSGETLSVIGQDLSDEIGILYQEQADLFQQQLPKGLEPLWNKTPGGVSRLEGSIVIPRELEDGSMTQVDVPGIFLAEVTAPRSQTGRTVVDAPTAFTMLAEEEATVEYAMSKEVKLDETLPLRVVSTLQGMEPGDLEKVTLDDGSARILFLRAMQPVQETMEASHILITYTGANSAPESLERTQEEALALAKDIRERIENGEEFAALAQEFSEGPSSKSGGSLGVFGRGDMVPAFEQAAFALKQGEISKPVETPFGYHIIRSDRAPGKEAPIASYDELIATGESAPALVEEMLERLQSGNVQRLEEQAHLRFLFFSLEPSGWKDTALDGKHFRSATVTLDQQTNLPVVQITFDDEGGRMFQELTKQNIGKRIAIFVGGQLISAPTVQNEISGGSAIITGSQNLNEARQLATDLNTGAIPAPIYLSGQRTVEATLGAAALRSAMEAAFIGSLLLMLYMVIVYRLLGLVADIALGLYAFLFFTFLKMPLFLFSGQYIVLTLAGMAGIILSIGMAVDANVLIFERIKEELRKGKLLKTAIRTGFERAWPSIRDGNASTFITCIILFLVGTSIVRGFAITLSTGILLSMFTAIIITRWFLNIIARTALAENRWMFCGPKNAAKAE